MTCEEAKCPLLDGFLWHNPGCDKAADTERIPMNLPDIELVSAKVHEAWMDSKRARGITSRKLESGEELMVPYSDLSENAKELDRATVRAVYEAIDKSVEFI